MRYAKPVSLVIANFAGPLAGNMVLALVPALKAEFSSTGPEVLLSITFYMIPFALFMLFSGALSDVYDRKKTMLAGFSVYASGALLCAVSPSLSIFLTARAIQGFGYAFITPVLLAIMGDIVSESIRGRWMGFMAASTTAGVAVGPLIGGFIGEINWRFSFVFVFLLTVAVASLFFWTFRDHWFERGEGSLRGVVVKITEMSRFRPMQMLSIAGFLTFLCYTSTLSFLSDMLSLPPLNLGEAEIGVMMTATGIAGVFASPIGGKLVDTIGRRSTATSGFLIVICGLAGLIVSSERIHYFVSLLVLGGGVAVVWSSLLTLTVEISPDKRGTASSLFNSSRFFGYALGPAVFAPLYVSYGIRAIEAVGILLAMAAIWVVWKIRSGDRHSPVNPNRKV